MNRGSSHERKFPSVLKLQQKSKNLLAPFYEMVLTLYRGHTSVKSFYSKHRRRELNQNCGLEVEHDGIDWVFGTKLVAMMEQNPYKS